MNDNVPVNKGHFHMDTEERFETFHMKLASGWEEEYKEYRDAWENLPRKKIIRNYPIQVDFELSAACNLRCPMCYTTTESFREIITNKYGKKLLLDINLFRKVINEIAGKVYAVRLSWRGEPTLHPKLIDFIRIAKDKNIKEVSFLTNGTKLELEYFIEMVKAGIDWITISVDGVDKTYDNIRKPLIFEETVEKIKAIYKYKTQNRLKKPVIKIQGIWPAIKENPEKYYNTFKPICDLIAFNPLIDYLGKDENIIYEENFSCPQLYERLFVASNGDVMMCNSDEFSREVLGNVANDSIYDIWHGEKLTGIRDLHNQKDGFKKINICTECFYPRKTEVNESANINGRTLLIENYINRKQSIGD